MKVGDEVPSRGTGLVGSRRGCQPDLVGGGVTKEAKCLASAIKLKGAIEGLGSPSFVIDFFGVKSMKDLDWLISNLELIVKDQAA